MDPAVGHVLAHYPAVLTAGTGGLTPRRSPEPLGSRGGFSGACLWRLDTPAGPLCLRACAPAETAAHLAWRHRLMRSARSAGLAFVPAVLATYEQGTVVEAAGRLWELLEWKPGQADYRQAPSEARLRAAVRAVARVHLVWASEERYGPCPAVARRLEAMQGWQRAAGFIPAGTSPAARLPLSRARRLLDRWMPRVESMLPAASNNRLQPCLRDVWHDHLLFEDQRLAGLIDYAAVGVDTVATDLARLLGSLVEDDEGGWEAGLNAYREVAPLSQEEERLARLLDRTGVVVGVFRWVRRLSGSAPPEDVPAALGRLETLVRRLEQWR